MHRFRCLPLLLLSSGVFFDCGRALRCLLPVDSGRFLHLVVLYGYQGADGDAEQLSLTDQLFDAALGELSVVALDQPCLVVGDFNVEPTKIPCLSKGIFAGPWVDLESAWAFASGVSPAVTCKRTWGDSGRHRRDFMVGCPLVAAARGLVLGRGMVCIRTVRLGGPIVRSVRRGASRDGDVDDVSLYS